MASLPSSPDAGGPGPGNPNSGPNSGTGSNPNTSPGSSSPNTGPSPDPNSAPNSSNPNSAPGSSNPNTAPGAPAGPDVDADPQLKIVIGNFDKNADAFAREAAHEELAEKPTGGFFKRFAKNVWNNVTREYQTVKRTQEKRKKIFEDDNLRTHQGEDDKKYREGAVRRAASEFGEKLIHEEAGESYHNLNDIINNTVVDPNADPDKDPAAKRVKQAERIKRDTLKLVRDFSVDSSDPDYIPDIASLEQAFKRVAQDWKDDGITEDLLGEGNLWGHNVVEMAVQARAAADTKIGLDAVQRAAYIDTLTSNAEVVAAELRVGSNVEVDARLSERIAEKMRGRKIFTEGNISKVVSVLGNELVVGAMLSAGVYLGRRGLAAALVVPGLGAAIVGGVRERRAIQDERDLMDRRIDNGEDPDLTREHWYSSRRQENIAEVMYESVQASDLMDALDVYYDSAGNLLISNESEFNDACKAVAEIKARLDIQIREKKRLIDFGDDIDEREFTNADLQHAMAKLEADLEALGADPANHTMLGITKSEEVQENIEVYTEIEIGSIRGEIRSKDKAFELVKAYYALKRGALTAGAAELFRELADALGTTFGGGKTATAPKMERVDYSTSIDGEPIGADDTTVEGEPIGSVSLNEGEPIGGEGATTQGEPIGAALNEGEPIGAREQATKGEPIGSSDATKGGPVGPARGEPIGSGGATTQGEPIGSATLNEGEPIGSTNATQTGEGEPIGNANATQTGEGEPIGSAGATQGGEGEPIGSAGGEKPGTLTEISKNAKIILPDGYKSEVNGDQVTIYGPNGQTINGQLDKNGALTQNTLDQLKNSGLNVQDKVVTTDGPLTVEHQSVTKQEFYENHKTEMVDVKRVGWFDDDTPKEYKLNEAKYDIIRMPNGDIRLSIARMTSDGSWHGDKSVQWREAAAQGHIKAYLSASRGTQGHALEFTFNKDGYVDIPKDSTAAGLFNEKDQFTGGFNEVALYEGNTPEGAHKITPLATIVGERNGGKVDDTIFHVGPKVQEHTYTVTEPAGPTQGEPIGEPWRDNKGFSNETEEGDAPAIPIYARTPLGRGKRRTSSPFSSSSSTTPPPPMGSGSRNTGGSYVPGSARPGATTPGSRRPGFNAGPNTGPNFSSGGPGGPANGGPGMTPPSAASAGAGSPAGNNGGTGGVSSPAGGYTYPPSTPSANIPPAGSVPNAGPANAGGAGTAAGQAGSAGNANNGAYSSPFDPATSQPGGAGTNNSGPSNGTAGPGTNTNSGPASTAGAGTAGARAGSAANAGGNAGSGTNTNQTATPPNYTQAEREALGRIDAEADASPDVPDALGFDVSNLDPYAAKLIKLAYYRTLQAMGADPLTSRRPYESDDQWNERVLDTMSQSAHEQRRQMNAFVPENLRTIFRSAYSEIMTAYQKVRGYSANGRRRT